MYYIKFKLVTIIRPAQRVRTVRDKAFINFPPNTLIKQLAEVTGVARGILETLEHFFLLKAN